ncbi:hypothetical protein LCM4573_26075 [Rhizobium sp. LCM 4573]|nr:hypothetical protein LCM4573_26075 [Rhizobium sp. LCM 4573]
MVFDEGVRGCEPKKAPAIPQCGDDPAAGDSVGPAIVVQKMRIFISYFKDSDPAAPPIKFCADCNFLWHQSLLAPVQEALPK